jgi:4-hydroxyacetophenone monooxygenase
VTDTTTDSTVEHGEPGLQLRAAIDHVNLPTLLMVLIHLSGDERWMAERYRPVRPRGADDNDSAGLPEDVQEEIRHAVFDAVSAYRAGTLTPAQLTPDQVARMLEFSIGEAVAPEYGPMLSEELGILSRDVAMPDLAHARPGTFPVIIIGSGFAGLCAAIKLAAAKIDFTVIEKNEDVGGTWLENVYPGAGVDTPSHLYCYSFAFEHRWSTYFAKRDEVWRYLNNVTDYYGLREHVRFGTEVQSAAYDEASGTWHVQVRDRDGNADVLVSTILISAVGMVNRPSVPPIDGLGTFAGPIMHTAQWRNDVDYRGKRVAVVGTGASAMQLVPSIVDEAERVIVFQRSRQWVLPHPNYKRQVSDAVKLAMTEIPFYAGWYRLRAFWNFGDRLHASLQVDPGWERPEHSINEANERHRTFLTRHIVTQLGDREDLIDACVPDYPPYVKRPLIDNGWFEVLRRDDVHLVTDEVTSADRNSVTTASGERFEVDVIALATGFKTRQFLWPMKLYGRSGRALAEVWGEEDARAYLGMTVPGFPNFFIMNGPNTFAGHGGSSVLNMEFQIRYVMQLIGHMIKKGLKSIEIRDDVFWTYNHELDEALNRTVWAHRGTSTYFRNSAGRVVVSSPWTYVDYWRRTAEAALGEYNVESR